MWILQPSNDDQQAQQLSFITALQADFLTSHMLLTNIFRGGFVGLVN